MRCPARKERAGQINIIISSGNYIHEKSRALSGGNARDTLKENNQPMSQTDWRPGRNCFKTINTRALYITYYIVCYPYHITTFLSFRHYNTLLSFVPRSPSPSVCAQNSKAKVF